MKLNKYVIAPAVAVITLGAVAFGGASFIKAQDSLDGYPLIVQKLAETFNLNADEVATVFDTVHAERETERLDNMVEDGVITEEQRDLIEEQASEIKSEMDDLRSQDLTQEEMHDAMQTLHEAMRSWADENDIPLGALGGPGLRGGRGMGGEFGGMGGPEGMGLGDCPYSESEAE